MLFSFSAENVGSFYELDETYVRIVVEHLCRPRSMGKPGSFDRLYGSILIHRRSFLYIGYCAR
jgi:hypothetical protein